MTRTTRTGSMAAAGAIALLLTLITACGAAHQGDVQPDAVEKKAHTLVQQTLDALHPTLGTPKTTVFVNDWSQCSTETPGQHRFDYEYALKVPVPHSEIKAALAAARADFTRRHYTLAYIPDPDSGAGASLPKTNWRTTLSVHGADSVLINVDSDCVFTRHDPKTSS